MVKPDPATSAGVSHLPRWSMDAPHSPQIKSLSVPYKSRIGHIFHSLRQISLKGDKFAAMIYVSMENAM